MYDLDALRSRCRRYHLKRLLPVVSVAVLLFAAVVAYLYPTHREQKVQTPPSPARAKTQTPNKPTAKKALAPKRQQTPQQPSQTAPAPADGKCYELQFASTKREYAAYLKPQKKRLESLGFECFYHYKKYAMLRCDKTRDKKRLLESIQKAKAHNLDYIVISKAQCDQAGEAEKKSPQDIEPPKRDHSRTQKRKTRKRPPSAATQPPSSTIEMKRSSINELEEIFKNRPSYSIALAIARNHFKNGDYENSLKWAKEANTLDREKEDAWIIYAKSLYNLDKRESAKQVLAFYLKFQNSQQVQELLQKWENEE